MFSSLCLIILSVHMVWNVAREFAVEIDIKFHALFVLDQVECVHELLNERE